MRHVANKARTPNHVKGVSSELWRSAKHYYDMGEVPKAPLERLIASAKTDPRALQGSRLCRGKH